MKKIIVVGGGAAGMMAALTIKENNSEIDVILIEKNSMLGKKVSISGGGRCNVTTGITEVKTVLSKYPRGSKFLSYAMYEFGPQKLMDWFSKHNFSLKTEKDLRVFPTSNKGEDVVKLLSETFVKLGGKVLLNQQVTGIEKTSAGFVVALKDNDNLVADKVILAVGGQAYRHTGSVGDGYTWAEKFGHNITSLSPSLNAFILNEEWVANLAGVSFSKIKLKTVFENNSYDFTGPAMLTHKGITGPAVFALSSLIAQQCDYKSQWKLCVDFLPEKNEDSLRSFFQVQTREHPGKTFKNTVDILLPRSLVTELFKICLIETDKKNAEIGKKDLQKIVATIKNLPLTVSGSSAGEEFVTAGGVDTEDVDAKTMESKICPGLYLAGEILNIDGFTGGFNLQAAWATGRIAGLAAIL